MFAPKCNLAEMFSFSVFLFVFFFSRASDERSYQKLEKVGPFECDELEKHCRVSAKCYPTKVPALYTMTKEKFDSSFLVLLLAACFPTDEKSSAGEK